MSETQKSIDLYCSMMEEVKCRDAVVKGFIDGKCRALFRATELECMCLQIRKILELIALGSLAMNRDIYAKYNAKFASHWHGGRILSAIEKLNPGFYPRPIKENPSDKPGIKSDWQDREEGILTREDFVIVYGKCGEILHTPNPFGPPLDYSYYDKSIPEWVSKIVTLLNSHTIRLVNDPNLYLIHMNDESNHRVRAYTFAPTSPEANSTTQ